MLCRAQAPITGNGIVTETRDIASYNRDGDIKCFRANILWPSR